MVAALSGPALRRSSPAAEVPGPARPAGRFGDLDEETVFDVCIIGSGFAGAILGESLVRRGIKTIILESGPDPRGKVTDARFHELDSYRSSGPIAYPAVSTRFRGLGGTSWLWGGNCTRLHPIDFENNSYTPVGASWPIRYADLEPYYERAEAGLRVRGGKQTVFEPPRKVDYPLPADRDVRPLESMLESVGISISQKPFATPVDREPALLSGRDGPFPRMTDTHLPNFQSWPYGALIAEVTVTRLLTDERGHVYGAEVKDLDRNVKLVRARAYVVASGGLESPRLLLLSRSRAFPEGIGNNSDWVGRCFMEHWPVAYTSRVNIGWSSFNLLQLSGFSHQFYSKFKRQGFGGMRLSFYLGGAAARDKLFSSDFPSVSGGLTRKFNIQIGTEMKPSPDNRVTLDKELKDYFGNPRDKSLSERVGGRRQDRGARQGDCREIYTTLGADQVQELPRNFWAHHHMGTCRMGDNPRTSVVDRNLRVHGTSNLFVTGSAVFVTSGTAHPTLNLAALSLRLSDHLRAQFRHGAFPNVRGVQSRKAVE